ncbi:MAG: trigger factor [Calditrichaeota bacterium]|nr:MAG: trigger factor [Calditrichota bacterium]
MQINVTDAGSLVRKIRVRIEPEELAEIEAKVVQALQKQAEVPGFRKGKVPANIVRKRYAETIRQEVAEKAIADTYYKAIEQSELEVATEGRISDFQFQSVDQGLEYEVEVEVMPEIELKKYKGLRVEKEKVRVTDQMVEEILERLQDQYATVREAEEVKEGLVVTLDVQELGEGDVPVIGRKHEGVRIKVGTGEFDPEFERQLLGAKVGEQRVVRREVPPTPDAQQQQPTTESYRVTITKIEEKELPELNDEFVKNLPDSDANTLEELKASIRESLSHALQKEADRNFRERLINEALKENPFEVPEGMVEHYLQHVIEDIKQQYQNEKIDEEFIRQQFRAQAINNIRWYMLKRKIAEVEQLDVSMEEVHQVIDTIPASDAEKEQAKNNPRVVDRLRDDLLEQKVLKLLETNAEIIEIEPQEASESDVS